MASPSLDRATWLAKRQGRKRHSQPGHRKRWWTRPEVARLESLVGKLTPIEMAAALGRTAAQVRQKLMLLGYSIPADLIEPLGLSGAGLSRRLNVGIEIVWTAIQRGQIKAVKKDKKDYLIRWPEVRRYERWLAAVVARRERALARIKVPTITKQAFMRLLGLSETHAARYLLGRVVKAWKIPCHWVNAAHHRWEWAVSQPDALRVKRLREAGKLRLRQKSYRKIVRAESLAINELKRQRRLGKRDDLKHTLSPVIPGCYTVAQVASRAGLSTEAVYNHIRTGRLAARRVQVGTRNYMAIPPEGVPAYLAWTRRKVLNPWAERRHTEADRVRAKGLLTIQDAARQFGLHPGTIAAACTSGRLKCRKVGRLRALKECDVRRFAETVRPRSKRTRKDK